MASTNICVIGGAGYVGLVTGLCLSHLGHNVINLDIDNARIQGLQDGISPIYEPNIDRLLASSLKSSRIKFTTDLRKAVESSDVIFLAVGTPPLEDGQPDTSQILEVMEQLVHYLKSYKVIVIKSTVTVAVFRSLRMILDKAPEAGGKSDLVSNPEFLTEGKGVTDFFSPDRIVFGADSERAMCVLRELYHPIINRQIDYAGNTQNSIDLASIPVIETNIESAQIIKYASNAFLATRISFINEIAQLCENVGANVGDVIQGLGYDSRIGHEYLSPGIGFGGPCLEKDLQALIGVSESHGCPAHVLKSVLERNKMQGKEVIKKLHRLVGEPLQGKTIAVFGLTFKADTNDMRNSPALKVIQYLGEEEAFVKAYDPMITPEPDWSTELVSYYNDPYEAVYGADALMILTEWKHFKGLDYLRIKQTMAAPRIVDGKNLLDQSALNELSFQYLGIGRE